MDCHTIFKSCALFSFLFVKQLHICLRSRLHLIALCVFFLLEVIVKKTSFLVKKTGFLYKSDINFSKLFLNDLVQII